MPWRLQYDRTVTAYLYSLREDGHQLHQAIKALATLEEPWRDAIEITDRPGQFEINEMGHWVGFQVLRADRVIRILYVENIG